MNPLACLFFCELQARLQHVHVRALGGIRCTCAYVPVVLDQWLCSDCCSSLTLEVVASVGE